ncbi:MAG: hypothetical protein EXS55_03190 [Candidatus Magasanikbacteria bacterium]|nr:hypothetical protein [Candidatus Magasanikbacteria bacterium]
MRNLSPILALLALSAVGCAGNMHAKVASIQHRPEYRLIVKAPKSILGSLDPKEYTFTIVAKAWGDKPSDYAFSEVTPAYCVLRGDELACMISVHETNAKFELGARHLQRDPRSIPEAERVEMERLWKTDETFREASLRKTFPPAFCDKVRVGITIDKFGFSGGIPTAAKWFDVEANKNGECQYYIPPAMFAATREASSPNVGDYLTD